MQISGNPVSQYPHNLHSHTPTAASGAGIKSDNPDPAEKTDAQEKASDVTVSSNSRTAEAELEKAELKQLRELRARDREVRAHEQAHASAAGSLAKGGPSYSYQRGPDGRLYAIGGEVQIDTSAVSGDPQATLQKAQQIRRAALAPAQPSSQDRAVAAQAAVMEAQARVELANARIEEAKNSISGDLDDMEGVKEVKGESHQELSETGASCEMCGGKHSAGFHAANVTEQVRKTFDLSEVRKETGSLLSTSA